MLHLVVIDGNTIALAVLIEEGIGLQCACLIGNI